MSDDKKLPDWAKPGTPVLIHGGYNGTRPSEITRVTKTSAFVGNRRFVRSRWDDTALEEYGQRSSWSPTTKLRPLDSDEAKSILRDVQVSAAYNALRAGIETGTKKLLSARYGRSVDVATVEEALAVITAAIDVFKRDGVKGA